MNAGNAYPGNVPQFKSHHNPYSVSHPPKLTVGGWAQTVYMNGSAENKKCTKRDCTFLHLDFLTKVTGGLLAMYLYINKTRGINWKTKALHDKAAKAKDTDEPGKG